MKQYFFLKLFLLTLAFALLNSCQSPISRSPSAVSSASTFNEIKTLTRELVLSISNVSKPQLMLFEQFEFQLNALDERNFQSDQFDSLGRSFHLMKNLSASLENDPFTEPLSQNSLRLISQINSAFQQRMNADPVQQRSMDFQIQRNFLVENKTRFLTLLNQPDVQMQAFEKQKIQALLKKLESTLEKYKEKNQIEMRSLASMSSMVPWSKKDRMFLEKISARSVLVLDQGDIFGGSEANLKAIQIQYSLHFILKVLSLHEQQNNGTAKR